MKQTQTTNIVVFDSTISQAKAARIQKALRAVEPSAYVIAGHESDRTRSFQPAYASVDGPVNSELRSRLHSIAVAVK